MPSGKGRCSCQVVRVDSLVMLKPFLTSVGGAILYGLEGLYFSITSSNLRPSTLRNYTLSFPSILFALLTLSVFIAQNVALLIHQQFNGAISSSLATTYNFAGLISDFDQSEASLVCVDPIR